MISRLTGTIVHIDLKYIILDVGGVGYKVFPTAEALANISGKKEIEKVVTAARPAILATPTPITLWTYLAVRENALDLYGFASPTELSFFELLITISGIGPKTALGILNTASVESLDSAIRSGETAHLVKVAGLGKKLAEKIVRELHDKIENLPQSHARMYDATTSSEDREKLKKEMRTDADALEALKSLGYTHSEAREALKEVDKKIKETGAKVKAALIILGK